MRVKKCCYNCRHLEDCVEGFINVFKPLDSRQKRKMKRRNIDMFDQFEQSYCRGWKKERTWWFRHYR